MQTFSLRGLKHQKVRQQCNILRFKKTKNKQLLSRYCSRIKHLKSRWAATVKPFFIVPEWHLTWQMITFTVRLDISTIGPFLRSRILRKLQWTAESNTLSCCNIKKLIALSIPTSLRREVVKRHFRVSINLCSLKKGTHIWVNYSKYFSTCKTVSDASSVVKQVLKHF